MNLLLRPDKIESRDDFFAYLEALLRSLDQALAAPPIPYGPAVDDQGAEWENTTLARFQEAMDAWMNNAGWIVHDRRESAVLAVLSMHDVDIGGDEEDLRQYLVPLGDWASSADLPADQDWRPAAEALAAGRCYE